MMILGRFSGRAWRRSILFALVFAAIFSLVAIARVVFVQNQANRDEIAYLKQTADEVSKQIYPGHWDPLGYRQSISQDQNYIILTSDGLLVDFAGFVLGLIAQAKPVDEGISEKPTLIKT